MPCRPLLADLKLRNGIICRVCQSCLPRIQTRRPSRAWAAQYSTESTAVRKQQRAVHKRDGKSLFDSRNAAPASDDPILEEIMTRMEDEPGAVQSENDFTINYFEQDERGTIRSLPDEETFDSAWTQVDDGELKTMVTSMRRAAGSDAERSAFDRVMNAVGSDWENVRGPADLARISTKLKAYSASIDQKIENLAKTMPEHIGREMIAMAAKLDDPPDELPEETQDSRRSPAFPEIPESRWTPNQRKKVARLNLVVRRVWNDLQRGKDISSTHVQAAYKAYHAARLTLARSWDGVPLDVWDFLWKLLSVEESVNVHRLAHVALLSRDMSDARVELSPTQQLLTIEATFVDGWEGRAVDSWKRCMSTLGDEKSETFRDFWELGVRMYCKLGELVKAQRALDRLLERHSSPRIMMPMIRTFSELGGPDNSQRAWDLYRNMRQRLGQTIKLSDYDQVISYFLTTNQVENALYAFVDMMSDGQIDLTKQQFIPSVVANKFFLGKWLKRLIGAGDLDGASRVVEFMRQKGVGASPIQLNGLIGAWHRSGGARDLENAGVMAWDMIESRIDFVKARSSKSIRVQSQDAWRTTKPRATLETFSLMAENYRIRAMHDQLKALWRAFREAEISPDAFMMNQLLESYISSNQQHEATELYKSLVDQGSVSPDPYTYSALWKTLAVNNYRGMNEETRRADIARARDLFREMMEHAHVFNGRTIDGQLARKILHTFRRLSDTPGTLVALAALKDIFKFLPPDTLVLEMAIGTTKLSWESSQSRRKLMVTKRDMDQSLNAWSGGNAENLTGEERGEALQDYMRQQLTASLPEGVNLKNAVREASFDMGVHAHPALNEH